MMALWNLVFLVVTRWLPEFQELQQCPTEEERGCPFLKSHQRETLSWSSHS